MLFFLKKKKVSGLTLEEEKGVFRETDIIMQINMLKLFLETE